MATPIEINDILVYLSRTYPSQTRGDRTFLTEEVIQVYEEMLADMPADTLWLLAFRHVREGNEFFPSVAQLCRQTSGLMMASFAECIWLRRQAEKYEFELSAVVLSDEIFER